MLIKGESWDFQLCHCTVVYILPTYITIYNQRNSAKLPFPLACQILMGTIWILLCGCGLKADTHFFTGFGGTNILLSSTIQIYKGKFHQNHHNLLNKTNISLTKSLGYSTVLGYLVFFSLCREFIYQAAPFRGVGWQTYNKNYFPLSSATKVWFLQIFFCLFSRHLTIFFSRLSWFEVVYSKWTLCPMANWI